MNTLNDSNGLFITFEGVEGAGKTTNIEYIAEKIKASGHEILLTREPGGTELSEAIRELLISKEYPEMHVTTELLLMFAARSEHLNKKILPAINEGKWVLCDRFTDATFAYQGGGRGISETTISTLETLVQGTLKPDFTFLFDLNAEIGLARAKNRGETDRFEQQHIDFFNRVRAKYLAMAEIEKHRYRIVNAEHDLSTVQIQISQLLTEIL
ncbi:MAG: dTMP kinase [Cocleimonas sp.]|jgi:dTMP kinase